MGPHFRTLAAQAAEAAIPLMEILQFRRFRHIGECCSDVQFPSSPLASLEPPCDFKFQHATDSWRSLKTLNAYLTSLPIGNGASFARPGAVLPRTRHT